MTRTGQRFAVEPLESRGIATGDRTRFEVSTVGGGQLPDRLFLGVLPCENYAFASGTFTGREGVVAGFDTDPGPRIRDVNGERFENVDDVWPVEVHVQSGALSFTVTSSEPGCGIAVVFEDTDGDGELDLDDQDRATEPYGAARVTFS